MRAGPKLDTGRCAQPNRGIFSLGPKPFSVTRKCDRALSGAYQRHAVQPAQLCGQDVTGLPGDRLQQIMLGDDSRQILMVADHDRGVIPVDHGRQYIQRAVGGHELKGLLHDFAHRFIAQLRIFDQAAE